MVRDIRLPPDSLRGCNMEERNSALAVYLIESSSSRPPNTPAPPPPSRAISRHSCQ